jgi:hypothetical protein
MEMIRKQATRFAAVASAASFALLFTVPAFSAERVSDRDVKQLMNRINNERDRFEDQLDGKLKGSIIRGAAGGEVNVSRFLDDLQDNVGKMKDRFKDDYPASAEVTTVLRQGSDIRRFMATQPPDFDGASEWNRLAASLGELATVYGTVFPIGEGQQARRINDEEVKKAAELVGKNADLFKKELDASLKNNTAIDVTTREAAVKDADGFKQSAERLASTIGDGKPASGEAQALLQHATAIRGATPGRPLSPAAQTAWGSVESELTKVAQAFNMPAWP